MAVKHRPDGFHTVTPMIIANDASSLISWMEKGLNAKVKSRHEGPDGKVAHAELQIGDSMIMMGEASDKWPAAGGVFYLYIEDVDALYKQAVAAGGKSLREPTNEFYGDRSAGVTDAYGNQWWMATHVEDVSEEEMQKRMEEWNKKQAAAK